MLDNKIELEVIRKDAIRLATVVVNLSKNYKSFQARAQRLGTEHSAPDNYRNWSTSAKSYEQCIENFWNWNTTRPYHRVRGQSALAEQIEERMWVIPSSVSQCHDPAGWRPDCRMASTNKSLAALNKTPLERPDRCPLGTTCEL